MSYRNALVEASKKRITKFHVPTLDVDVFIRPLTGAQRAELGDKLQSLGDKPQVSSVAKEWVYRAIAASLVTESGDQIYSNQEADLSAIGELDAQALDEIRDEIMLRSGLSKKAVEEATKNFVPVQSAASPSA